MTTNNAQRIAETYGVQESNPLTDPDSYWKQEFEHMGLAEFAERGGKVTRVRWLTEAIGPKRRIADLSYIHGVLPDGQAVRIAPGGNTNAIAYPKMRQALIEWAKDEGVYAKALGLLDDANWSVLR